MKFCILIIFGGWTAFNKTIFVRNGKYEHGGRLIFKINFFYGCNSWTVGQIKFVQWNIVDKPTSFIWIIIFLNRPSEYADGGIFKLLRWMQDLHQSMWDHKTTFNMTTFARIQTYERGRWLKVKIHILFYGQNSWTAALGQMKYCTLKDHGHTYKCYLNRYSLMELLNMAVFQNFEVICLYKC
jgi:hypothetical protein